MSSVGNNVNSYDAGGKPFQHDSSRGKWSSISDFYLGCIGHAFGMRCFSIIPFLIQYHGGVFFIIPYIISLFVFALPIFIFQSFLGQFSSTGFISVFRISPLFKGVGYVILILNLSSVCYFSAITAYPLVYFLISFDPSLPWMSCNHTFNSPNCTEKFTPSLNESSDVPLYSHDISWSTLEYYQYAISNIGLEGDNVTRIAWPIFVCTILIWLFLAGVFYKGFKMINLLIRCCAGISLFLFAIFFVRILCLTGGLTLAWRFLIPQPHTIHVIDMFVSTPFLTVFIFGSGWGTVLTMASYNHFKADIFRYSQIVTISLPFLFAACALSTYIIEEYLYEYLNFSHYSYDDYIVEFILVGIPYLLGHLEAPQIWSIIFFLMLLLSELCGLIIQLLSIMTAIFDEYPKLRVEKTRITLAIISCLGLSSLMFTTNKEIPFFNILMCLSGVTQMGICFLELIIVVWFYGRERFQRDIQFMLGKTFASWKFFVIRFITPFLTLLMMLFFLIFFVGGILVIGVSVFEVILIFIVKVFPWLCIPIYIGIKLASTTGTLYHRFKKSIWPTDWYPVDPLYRQRYEETFGTSDISHQLVMMTPDEEEP